MPSPAVPTGSTTSQSEAALITTVLALARRFARRRMTRDAADDVAQDVAVAFCNKMSPDGSRSSPPLEVVVWHMVRERAIDRTRRDASRKARESTYAREVERTSHSWMRPEASIEEEELGALREEIVRELSDRCREAFRMVREEEVPYGEASKRLGIRRGSVRRLVVRAEGVFSRRLAAEGIVVPTGNARRRVKSAAGG
jgi:RNA polymerase sigma factor (sigma-70 family)